MKGLNGNDVVQPVFVQAPVHIRSNLCLLSGVIKKGMTLITIYRTDSHAIRQSVISLRWSRP